MKNPAPYIRQSLYTLLNGAVNYDGVTVPVYESEYTGDPVKYKIEIAAMDGSADNDKAGFNSDYSTTLEVISEGHSWIRKHVDNIGNTIMGIIKPTIYTTGIADNSEWQVTNLTIQPPHYIEDEGASGSKIMRLILRLDFLIHQR